MAMIRIGGQSFAVKDYYCSQDSNYLPREDGKLWLYVNLTDVCPASCPFCVNPGRKSGNTDFDLSVYETTLRKIQTHIYGVSFTGGEPMLTPDLLDQAVLLTAGIMGPEVEIDIVTNGINLEKILELRCLERLDSIHLSRHRIGDRENDELMGIKTPSKKTIGQVITQLKDKDKVVFNCLLSKDGVNSADSAAQYLEMAADAGVCNTSFIGMMPVNEYCTEQRVDPDEIDLAQERRFRIWNRFHDYDYCSCCSGDYHAASRYVKFYFRAAGNKKAPYARQIVYTHDNCLLKGFGGEKLNLHI